MPHRKKFRGYYRKAYYTHQVIELPPIEMDIHHFVLQQGQCQGCGRERKAQVPRAQQAGYGPRLTALIGELAGIHRPSWRLVQDFCHSVLHIPMSLGAVHKVINRVEVYPFVKTKIDLE